MKFADVFSDPSSRVYKAVLVVDINDSTHLKEREPEATWIPTYGWFYDLVSAVVVDQAGTVAKYLGDGIVSIFGEDDAARAVNAAISIQERVTDANDKMRVSFTCSIGIAYGEVVQFRRDDGALDYLGLTVDRAFRLCSAANAKAIFVDAETVSAAAMNKVQSRVGLALKRKVADYQGPQEKITVKGFSAPVGYHEIWWSTDRYGVRAGFVTREAESKPVHAEGKGPYGPAAVARPGNGTWLHGEIKRWGHGVDFGFITSGDEDFYFNRTYLFASSSEPDEGARVVFVPLPALEQGKSRRADKIFVLGDQLRGRVTRIHPRGYGFADVADQHGDQHSLFILVGDQVTVRPGDHIECTVGENQQGPIGVDIQVLQSS